MRVYHISRKRIGLTAFAAAVLLSGALLLGGCFRKAEESPQPVILSTEARQVEYLESLGWTVNPTPVEMLDLELPDLTDDTWSSYTQLQSEQGFPFSDYAGCEVQRYTYAITNYPDIETGVQANLYLCDGTLIGGDVIFTGQGGFRQGLSYLAAESE